MIRKCFSRATQYPRIFAAALIVGSVLLSACDADVAQIAPSGDPHEFYASLEFPTRAVNLALTPRYDTLRFRPVALFADGTPVPGTIELSSTDSAVTIDSDGLLTAHAITTSPVRVRASLAYRGVIRRDSVLVVVTAAPPTASVAHLTIRPPDGDSAFLADGVARQMQLTVDARDIHGATVPGLAVDLQSADTTVVDVNSDAVVRLVSPGRTKIYANAMMYGVLVHDSLDFLVGRSRRFDIPFRRETVGDRNSPVVMPTLTSYGGTSILIHDSLTIRIGVNGIVIWSNFLWLAQGGPPLPFVPLGITFGDPSNVMPSGLDCDTTLYDGFPGTCVDAHPNVGGNIVSFVPVDVPVFLGNDDAGNPTVLHLVTRNGAGRRFPVPGRYSWRANEFGLSGIILVCRDDDPCL